MVQQFLISVLDLVYPKLCLACGNNLPPLNDLLCVMCQYDLPETRQHEQLENAFTEVFWGRVPIVCGAALYFFSKSGRVQQLIHQLKYKNRPEIGQKLGEYYGRQLVLQPHFQELDAVVPVPLHPKKKHQRGYNQAEAFGKGLAKGMQLPIWPYALRRSTYTTTQTKKSREDRLGNVQRAFLLNQAKRLQNKHILLVDDVLTTGATLEACASLIVTLEGAKVSLVTLAIAD